MGLIRLDEDTTSWLQETCPYILGNVHATERTSGRRDKASATKAVDLGSILGRIRSKTKEWYSQLFCLMFGNT